MIDNIKVFKALSDENRIKILNIISERNICAKGIAKNINLTEAAVSQHIKILKECDLIEGYKRGYRIVYRLKYETLDAAKKIIDSIKNDNKVSFKCNCACKNNNCYYKSIQEEDLKMKICFPVSNNLGLESVPYGHFGTAPMFVVCDLEKGEVRAIGNGDLGHEHGHCQPMKALCNENVDAVVVGGIGRGAINGLNAQGIKVFKAVEGTIQDNIDAYKNNKLIEFSVNDACAHHHGIDLK